MNARLPPPGPPSGPPEAVAAPQSVAEFIAAGELEEQRAERGAEELDKLLAKQRENLAQLRGFLHPVVSLILYRTIRTQLAANTEKAVLLSRRRANLARKLTTARARLAVIDRFADSNGERRSAEDQQPAEGVVLPFIRGTR